MTGKNNAKRFTTIIISKQLAAGCDDSLCATILIVVTVYVHTFNLM